MGINKGYVVTYRQYKKKSHPRSEKAYQRRKLLQEVVREVAGFPPYEKRVMELLKVGTAATQKRALKMTKKRLGTLKRAKRKIEVLTRIIQAQKQQATHPVKK